MTLTQRLNKILSEQGMTKTEFADSIGVTQNYICILTSEVSSAARGSNISPSLTAVFGASSKGVCFGAGSSFGFGASTFIFFGLLRHF